MPSIHIIVENSHVILEGFVTSERQKNLIYDRVNAGSKFLTDNPPGQIPASVQNNLKVLDTAR